MQRKKRQPLRSERVLTDIEKNIQKLRADFERSDDLRIRRLHVDMDGQSTPVALVFLVTVTDMHRLDRIIMSLQKDRASADIMPTALSDRLKRFEEELLTGGSVLAITHWNKATKELLFGAALLFVDGAAVIYALRIPKKTGRSPEEPESEQVVRGPHYGFVEDLYENIALVRRRMNSRSLKVEVTEVGRISLTKIALLYIEGVIDQRVLAEVKERLAYIDINEVASSNTIEEWIEDHPISILPQIAHTERPDVAASALADGRFVILVDGSPSILIAPSTFIEFFHSPEDQYERYYFSSFTRILRYLGAFISLAFPSIYVALTTFHPEMLPSLLLFSIASSRAGIPFPALMEALIMESIFELLREAGLRLPRSVGQAVSIVGALVIGEGAVRAGLVSQAMVIVVAITGITSFAIPAFNQAQAFRMLRFPLLLLGGTLGVLGLLCGLSLLLLHLCGIRSFGVPYLSPLSPLEPLALRSKLLRFPLWTITKRDDYLAPSYNTRRIGKSAGRRRMALMAPDGLYSLPVDKRRPFTPLNQMVRLPKGGVEGRHDGDQ
ncbi:spore germination protein [Heliobacterium undosum]|uniref:Spore germination protein n=1 Tax=Heliomicrobium undosum TaxID=121734 RepID=A0A845KXE2_9FIRM|nr:spore germination protein [Heliomicrobium undosum]MZP28222.1 spore germination protein [Heliomicrobium undosum]